jgi:hypothetical protein
MTHPLDGIRAKIERADEHIKNLNTEITAFLNNDAYRILTHRDADLRQATLSIAGPEPPLRFSAIAGEVIHQLRSSLDYLIRALVIENNQSPTERHQFPVCTTREKYEAAIKARRIEGVAASAAATVESLQPYTDAKTADTHTLRVLQDLDNTDKHRLLVVVTAVASLNDVVFQEMDRDVVITDMSPPQWPLRPSEHGTKALTITFNRPEPGVQMTGKASYQIAFDEFGPFREQPVIERLQEMRDRVVWAINLFASEFRT